MYIKGNKNTILWYIVFAIQWALSITCFIILLQINYYSIPLEETQEVETTGTEKPLMDILQESTNNTIQLSFGEWKGTKAGCYCGNNDTILLNKCPENQTDCIEDIPKVQGQTIYTWRNKSLYTTLSKYDYNELFEKSVDENKECPIGCKICGKLDFLTILYVVQKMKIVQ